jgi:hypothetical protein
MLTAHVVESKQTIARQSSGAVLPPLLPKWSATWPMPSDDKGLRLLPLLLNLLLALLFDLSLALLFELLLALLLKLALALLLLLLALLINLPLALLFELLLPLLLKLALDAPGKCLPPKPGMPYGIDGYDCRPRSGTRKTETADNLSVRLDVAVLLRLKRGGGPDLNWRSLLPACRVRGFRQASFPRTYNLHRLEVRAQLPPVQDTRAPALGYVTLSARGEP